MKTERTTVNAPAHDLAVLREEAIRQGVPLSTLLRAAIAHEAAALRRVRGLTAGTGGHGRGHG